MIPVSAGILIREDKKILFTSRPPDKTWAGWWEFPGGKIESNETPYQALQRELFEELGISVETATPWLTKIHAYPNRTVQIHFFKVHKWWGEISPQEGQSYLWEDIDQLTIQENLLPANVPLIQALQLPDIYLISNVFEMGESAFLTRLTQQVQAGIRMIQVRENHLSLIKIEKLLIKIQEICTPFSAKIFLNTHIELARKQQIAGVHLPSVLLEKLERRPEGLLVGASTHNAQELARAISLDIDFVTLSPVKTTQSHPNVEGIGWEKFQQLIQNTPIPVYAQGGLRLEDLAEAQTVGAQGIAMMRAYEGSV